MICLLDPVCLRETLTSIELFLSIILDENHIWIVLSLFWIYCSFILMRSWDIPIIPRNQLGRKSKRIEISNEFWLLYFLNIAEDKRFIAKVIYKHDFKIFVLLAISKGFAVEIILDPKTFLESIDDIRSIKLQYPENIRIFKYNKSIRHGILFNDDIILENLSDIDIHYAPFKTAIFIKNARYPHLYEFNRTFEEIKMDSYELKNYKDGIDSDKDRWKEK